MIRTARFAAALVITLTALALVGSSHSAMAQTNCTSGTLKTASDCFNKLLDQANADMQAKYKETSAGGLAVNRIEC